MTFPSARKREKIKPLKRDTVRDSVVVLPAKVIGGIKSRAGKRRSRKRRSHTATWLLNDPGSSVATCFCVSMKIQRPDHPEWNHHAFIHRDVLLFWALGYSSEQGRQKS